VIDTDDPFEEMADEYDAWYDRHGLGYRSELRALRRLVGRPGRALEVGVGTGRFASPLGVAFGVDPAGAMLRRARDQGMAVIRAVGEELPVEGESLDLVLVVLTLCFFEAPDRALTEARRVLHPDGRLVVGFLDPTSPPGRRYREESRGPFYEAARFYTPDETTGFLREAGFRVRRVVQTLFFLPSELSEVDAPRAGVGGGMFAAVEAIPVANDTAGDTGGRTGKTISPSCRQCF